MTGFLNDALRHMVGLSLVALGFGLELWQRIQMRRFRADQARLRDRYGIDARTPVLPYGPEQRRSIDAAASRLGTRARYALTSGSTAEPKRILYPPERVRRARWAFLDAFARGFATSPWQRHVFYVFGSLHQDDSLTSFMMAETSPPTYLATLQAPYRLQESAALQALAREYGDAALRTWVLALSNPGILYSTNPSTLSTFLDMLRRDWTSASMLVRDFVGDPPRFPPEVRVIARRLISRGARERLRRIAVSEMPLELRHIAPAVHTYTCWTGGYVQPFLRRLAAHLPDSRYRLLPMYSMSTETPETTPCYRGDRIAFIPLAKGVCYEFLPEGLADEPANLVLPHALQHGLAYSMVVSDAYGLRRYQTDDLFLCAGHVGKLPDLRFLRRRSLSYSFTGEKLTAEQVGMALDRLSTEFPKLSAEAFLTCVPSTESSAPHYRLIRVLGRATADIAMEAMTVRCDDLLSEINAEYRAKRRSGRLAPMRGMTVELDEFLRRMRGRRFRTWEGQFKFLPLYAQPWESEESGASTEVA